MDLLGIPSIDALRRSHRDWAEQALARHEQARESKWSESIAVGNRDFVETIKGKLGVRAKRRRFSGTGDEATLRQPQADYVDHFEAKST
jgi:putative transposase